MVTKTTPERVRERFRSLTAYQYTAAAPQACTCEELVASRLRNQAVDAIEPMRFATKGRTCCSGQNGPAR